MIYQHKNLAKSRWFKLSFFEQMANIGSEVFRACKWKNKNLKHSQLASDRALELLFLTIDDKKNINRLSELTRLYECLVDYFYFDNIYKTKEDKLNNYFNAFNYAVRLNK